MRWMKLEPIIQSEVSQKEKHQYSILTHIYGFIKLVTITLHARQKKRHGCTEQTFGLYGRRRGWDDLREQHRNMYIIKCETDRLGRMRQVLRAGALGWPRGMGWGGRREGGSGWGTHVNPWLIHVNVWQNHYNIVISLQLIKIIGKKNKICVSFKRMRKGRWMLS